jgi:hypothetical protein
VSGKWDSEALATQPASSSSIFAEVLSKSGRFGELLNGALHRKESYSDDKILSDQAMMALGAGACRVKGRYDI